MIQKRKVSKFPTILEKSLDSLGDSEEKKSRHLMKAEKALLKDNVPTTTLKVGCLQLNQDSGKYRLIQIDMDVL